MIVTQQERATKRWDQPARLAVGSRICALDTGIVKPTVVPSPTVLSTQILPPCASTSPLEMNKPNPLPPLLCCACQYRSKIRGSSLGAIPGPQSRTVNSISLSRNCTESVTTPCEGEYLMALPTLHASGGPDHSDTCANDQDDDDGNERKRLHYRKNNLFIFSRCALSRQAHPFTTPPK